MSRAELKIVQLEPWLEPAWLVLITIIHMYHSSKIAKAGPVYDVRPEHPPVQINSSSP